MNHASRFPIGLLAITVLVLLFCPALQAQGPFPDAPSTAIASLRMPSAEPPAAAPVIVAPTSPEVAHRFWDKQNRILFITLAALNGADFALTRSNLQNGGQELNPIVRVFGRSTPGLAVNFIGETAASVSISYFFHKTGHHKLERITSYVNIGGSAGAVTYGLSHR